MLRTKSNVLRLACFLLVAALCVLCFAACGDDSDEAGNSSGTNSNKPVGGTVNSGTSDGTESGGTGDDKTEDTFLYQDYYEDTTLTILCVEAARHTYGELQFVPDDESAYTKVSEAVKARNDLIEQNHGLKIEIHSEKYPVEYLRDQVIAGGAEFDLVCESVDRMVQSVTESLFWSIEPEKLSLNSSWWDKEAMDAISIAGRAYFISGDALITDDDNIYLYLYNKEMYNNNTALTSRGDIYQIVKDGNFTLDLFKEMCVEASHPDENGNWGFTATYGNLSHAYGATVLVNGCNFATVTTDPDTEDYFQINVVSGQGQTVFGKVFDIMSDKQLTQRAELIIGMGSNPSTYGFAELEEMFINGRGLFYNTTSSSISILKRVDMSFDFGVLPTPKFDAEQDRYCNTVNAYQSSVLGIPICCTNLDAAYVLLDALGYYSADVKKAYYEETLQLQTLAGEDAEMLDLVYGSRFYDIGAFFNWGTGSNSLLNIYGSLISGSTNELTSRWESAESAIKQAMEETVEAYRNSIT